MFSECCHLSSKNCIELLVKSRVLWCVVSLLAIICKVALGWLGWFDIALGPENHDSSNQSSNLQEYRGFITELDAASFAPFFP